MLSKLNHKDRAHAMLSPSAADRWLNCNQSVALTAHIADKTSVYAEEGTLAHEMCEAKLRERVGIWTKSKSNSVLKKIRANKLYDSSMEEHTDNYVDYVVEKFSQIKANTPDASISIEERVHFTEYVPKGSGSCDCVIIGDGALTVIDFKYGQGVRVDAEENPQAMLYAIGAILSNEMYFDVDKVKVCIHQPRVNNISEWDTTVQELKAWAQYYVKPRAKLAWEGRGTIEPGDWCKFCKISGTCKVRSDKAMEEAATFFDFDGELTNEELGEALLKFDKIKDFMKAAEAAAFEKAMAGEEVPGHKLVEGRSTRKYTSEEEVYTTLINHGYDQSTISETKILGITAMEKAITKKAFADLLGNLVDKPQGKPTLVPQSDKRPAFVPENEIFQDIIND